jgi:hypothetical protein
MPQPGRGALGATPGLVITVWVSRAAQQGQVRSLLRPAAAMRAGHVRGTARVGVPRDRQASWRLRGRLSPGAGCMRCNESRWLPGQARDVTSDAEARRVRRSCGAGGQRSPGPPMMRPVQPAAPGCIAMPAGATMMHAAQRHQPHHRCIGSRRDDEVPSHRSRTALRQAEGRRNAACCAAGSACSREVPNVASDATPRL